MKSIFLVGFMGSGKSTVGKEISEKLNLPFSDTDDQIEKIYGPIPKIFVEKGEDVFRTYETKVLEQLPLGRIVSTGGGIIERDENIQVMKKNGMIIYLHASFEEIKRRIGTDPNRPLWDEGIQKSKKLYERRIPIYRKICHKEINTDEKSIEAIVEEILLKVHT